MTNIAHNVKCSICNTNFDRDKYAFVMTGARRYAHADCALRQATDNNKKLELEIKDPNDFITCKYCKKIFNKNEEEYIQISNSVYAHLSCSELEARREKTDAEKLDEYIMKDMKKQFNHLKEEII